MIEFVAYPPPDATLRRYRLSIRISEPYSIVAAGISELITLVTTKLAVPLSRLGWSCECTPIYLHTEGLPVHMGPTSHRALARRGRRLLPPAAPARTRLIIALLLIGALTVEASPHSAFRARGSRPYAGAHPIAFLHPDDARTTSAGAASGVPVFSAPVPAPIPGPEQPSAPRAATPSTRRTPEVAVAPLEPTKPEPTPPPRRPLSESLPLPPGAGGTWPDAASTGVPRGLVLQQSGSITVTEPGTVLDGLDISGSITIAANDVTIENTRVTGSDYDLISIKDGLTGSVVENTELDGRGVVHGASGSMGIIGPVTVLRSDIHGVENGVTPSSGSIIEGNYIHDLGAPGSPHYDGIQIDGDVSNVLIQYNTIDESDLHQTSCVMIDNYFGPIKNIKVDSNRLSGAGYTVYSDGQFHNGSMTGVKFTNNVIGPGLYGYVMIRDNTVVWSGNTDASSGRTVGSH